MKFLRKIVGLTLLLFTSVSYAQNSNGWHFLIAPYGWLPWIHGDLTIRNRSSKIRSKPKDVVNALDSALLVHIEIGKGSWTLMLDPTYMKISHKILRTTIAFKQTLFDFGGYYRVMNKTFNNNRLTGELFAGGRYWNMTGELSSPLFRKVTRTREWVDPIIGGRLLYFISDKWILAGHGDIGGFGLSSHFTWQLKAHALYQFNPHFGLAAGFRVVDVNYSTETGNNRFKYNAISYGPIIGFVLKS